MHSHVDFKSAIGIKRFAAYFTLMGTISGMRF